MDRKQALLLKPGDWVRHKVDEVQGKVQGWSRHGSLVHFQWEDGKETSSRPEDCCEIEKIS